MTLIEERPTRRPLGADDLGDPIERALRLMAAVAPRTQLQPDLATLTRWVRRQPDPEAALGRLVREASNGVVNSLDDDAGREGGAPTNFVSTAAEARPAVAVRISGPTGP
ncbi:MAG: hypothetical protein ACYDH6_23335, partial [Acidimicrobiales bacterium]